MDPIVHQQRISKPQPTLRCLLSPNSTLIVPNKVLLAVRSRFSLSIQSIKIYTLETTIPEQSQQHTTPPLKGNQRTSRVRRDTEFEVSNLSLGLLRMKTAYHINKSWFLYTFLHLLGHSCGQKNTYISIICLLPPVKVIIQI